jgi:hypothetical protein
MGPIDPLEVWENEGGALGPQAPLESLFRWETLKEVRPYTLLYEQPVPGTVLEVELIGGAKVRVWRADNRQDYFCHGLTFGGKGAPGGPVSPLSDHVSTILRGHYEKIPEGEATIGDILVWRGIDDDDILHSAILVEPVKVPGKTYLDYASGLRTKNGMEPEVTMTLERLIDPYYGESYHAYRRK